MGSAGGSKDAPLVKEEEFQPEWGEEELPDFGSDEEDALGETIELREKTETKMITILTR